MIYYKELRLNFNPFDGLPEHYFSPNLHYKLNTNIWNKFVKIKDLNQETLTWFEGNNLKLHNCVFFSYQPGSYGAPHSDGFIYKDGTDTRPFSAINFYQGGKGAMQWFRCNNDSYGQTEKTQLAKSDYIRYSNSEVTLVDSYSGTNPVLVDTETPHHGTNIGNELRYTITLRWRPVLTFQQALEKFEKYIL